jgi:hypothetical protein
MVALKLELAPDKRTVLVGTGSDTMPGTGTNLGTINHNQTPDSVHVYGPNHTVWHHIRDILYRRDPTTPANVVMWPYGFHDMSQVKLTRFGPIMTSTALTATDLAIVAPATATIVLKYQPGNVAAANADHDFVVGNMLVASVSAAGVVTGIATGTTYVRATNKFNGLMVDVLVSVTGTLLMAAEEKKEEAAKAKEDHHHHKGKDDDDDEDTKKKSKK